MDWMKNLPAWILDYPITSVAIPGSHDSGSYSLDPNSPYAPDNPNSLIRVLRALGCLARPVVYRWSVTQAYSFAQQLQAGIRYLDLRISRGPAANQFSVVHGLYGTDIQDCLNTVRQFSEQNPSEVIILDLNHLYAMNLFDHQQLVDIIVDMLGPILVPCTTTLELLSLNAIWRTPYRVFVFYHHSIACCFPKHLWPSGVICCPWPNVTDRGQLISYLDARYSCGPTPPQIFYGTQGILTPTAEVILRAPMRSLKAWTGANTMAAVTRWMESKREDNWFNIVIMDFVELEGFCQSVVRLNEYKKPGQLARIVKLCEENNHENAQDKSETSDPVVTGDSGDAPHSN